MKFWPIVYGCISILLGLLLAVTHTARFVPTVVFGFLTKVGDLSTPLSLIYIGALAGGSGIVQLFKEKMALEISVVKMIGMPALAILAMLFIPADGLASRCSCFPFACPRRRSCR